MIAASILTLSGCSTLPSVTTPQPIRQPPAAALVECQTPGPLTDPTLAGLLRKALELADALADCRARHDELRTWLGST